MNIISDISELSRGFSDFSEIFFRPRTRSAAGQDDPGRLAAVPGVGDFDPLRAGRVSVESSAKIKKLVHPCRACRVKSKNRITFLSRASSKRTYGKFEKYPTMPTLKNPQNIKRHLTKA